MHSLSNVGFNAGLSKFSCECSSIFLIDVRIFSVPIKIHKFFMDRSCSEEFVNQFSFCRNRKKKD